jgi:hypothetical protein
MKQTRPTRVPQWFQIVNASEVSDSMMRHDLDMKIPPCARHSKWQLWVVELPGLFNETSPPGHSASPGCHSPYR